VHEHIATAIIGLDEAVAAFSIEELDYSSHGHRETPPRIALPLAHLAYRPTGHSLPEAWPPEPIGLMLPTGLDFIRP
jgi:hypothetical protein